MDDAPQTAPFGTWTSPITAELLSRGSIRFEGLQVNVSPEHLTSPPQVQK